MALTKKNRIFIDYLFRILILINTICFTSPNTLEKEMYYQIDIDNSSDFQYNFSYKLHSNNEKFYLYLNFPQSEDNFKIECKEIDFDSTENNQSFIFVDTTKGDINEDMMLNFKIIITNSKNIYVNIFIIDSDRQYLPAPHNKLQTFISNTFNLNNEKSQTFIMYKDFLDMSYINVTILLKNYKDFKLEVSYYDNLSNKYINHKNDIDGNITISFLKNKKYNYDIAETIKLSYTNINSDSDSKNKKPYYEIKVNRENYNEAVFFNVLKNIPNKFYYYISQTPKRFVVDMRLSNEYALDLSEKFNYSTLKIYNNKSFNINEINISDFSDNSLNNIVDSNISVRATTKGLIVKKFDLENNYSNYLLLELTLKEEIIEEEKYLFDNKLIYVYLSSINKKVITNNVYIADIKKNIPLIYSVDSLDELYLNKYINIYIEGKQLIAAVSYEFPVLSHDLLNKYSYSYFEGDKQAVNYELEKGLVNKYKTLYITLLIKSETYSPILFWFILADSTLRYNGFKFSNNNPEQFYNLKSGSSIIYLFNIDDEKIEEYNSLIAYNNISYGNSIFKIKLLKKLPKNMDIEFNSIVENDHIRFDLKQNKIVAIKIEAKSNVNGSFLLSNLLKSNVPYKYGISSVYKLKSNIIISKTKTINFEESQMDSLKLEIKILNITSDVSLVIKFNNQKQDKSYKLNSTSKNILLYLQQDEGIKSVTFTYNDDLLVCIKSTPELVNANSYIIEDNLYEIIRENKMLTYIIPYNINNNEKISINDLYQTNLLLTANNCIFKGFVYYIDTNGFTSNEKMYSVSYNDLYNGKPEESSSEIMFDIYNNIKTNYFLILNMYVEIIDKNYKSSITINNEFSNHINIANNLNKEYIFNTKSIFDFKLQKNVNVKNNYLLINLYKNSNDKCVIILNNEVINIAENKDNGYFIKKLSDKQLNNEIMYSLICNKNVITNAIINASYVAEEYNTSDLIPKDKSKIEFNLYDLVIYNELDKELNLLKTEELSLSLLLNLNLKFFNNLESSNVVYKLIINEGFHQISTDSEEFNLLNLIKGNYLFSSNIDGFKNILISSIPNIVDKYSATVLASDLNSGIHYLYEIFQYNAFSNNKKLYFLNNESDIHLSSSDINILSENSILLKYTNDVYLISVYDSKNINILYVSDDDIINNSNKAINLLTIQDKKKYNSILFKIKFNNIKEQHSNKAIINYFDLYSTYRNELPALRHNYLFRSDNYFGSSKVLKFSKTSNSERLNSDNYLEYMTIRFESLPEFAKLVVLYYDLTQDSFAVKEKNFYMNINETKNEYGIKAKLNYKEMDIVGMYIDKDNYKTPEYSILSVPISYNNHSYFNYFEELSCTINHLFSGTINVVVKNNYIVYNPKYEVYIISDSNKTVVSNIKSKRFSKLEEVKFPIDNTKSQLEDDTTDNEYLAISYDIESVDFYNPSINLNISGKLILIDSNTIVAPYNSYIKDTVLSYNDPVVYMLKNIIDKYAEDTKIYIYIPEANTNIVVLMSYEVIDNISNISKDDYIQKSIKEVKFKQDTKLIQLDIASNIYNDVIYLYTFLDNETAQYKCSIEIFISKHNYIYTDIMFNSNTNNYLDLQLNMMSFNQNSFLFIENKTNIKNENIDNNNDNNQNNYAVYINYNLDNSSNILLSKGEPFNNNPETSLISYFSTSENKNDTFVPYNYYSFNSIETNKRLLVYKLTTYLPAYVNFHIIKLIKFNDYTDKISININDVNSKFLAIEIMNNNKITLNVIHNTKFKYYIHNVSNDDYSQLGIQFTEDKKLIYFLYNNDQFEEYSSNNEGSLNIVIHNNQKENVKSAFVLKLFKVYINNYPYINSSNVNINIKKNENCFKFNISQEFNSTFSNIYLNLKSNNTKISGLSLTLLKTNSCLDTNLEHIIYPNSSSSINNNSNNYSFYNTIILLNSLTFETYKSIYQYHMLFCFRSQEESNLDVSFTKLSAIERYSANNVYEEVKEISNNVLFYYQINKDLLINNYNNILLEIISQKNLEYMVYLPQIKLHYKTRFVDSERFELILNSNKIKSLLKNGNFIIIKFLFIYENTNNNNNSLFVKINSFEKSTPTNNIINYNNLLFKLKHNTNNSIYDIEGNKEKITFEWNNFLDLKNEYSNPVYKLYILKEKVKIYTYYDLLKYFNNNNFDKFIIKIIENKTNISLYLDTTFYYGAFLVATDSQLKRTIMYPKLNSFACIVNELYSNKDREDDLIELKFSNVINKSILKTSTKAFKYKYIKEKANIIDVVLNKELIKLKKVLIMPDYNNLNNLSDLDLKQEGQIVEINNYNGNNSILIPPFDNEINTNYYYMVIHYNLYKSLSSNNRNSVAIKFYKTQSKIVNNKIIRYGESYIDPIMLDKELTFHFQKDFLNEFNYFLGNIEYDVEIEIKSSINIYSITVIKSKNYKYSVNNVEEYKTDVFTLGYFKSGLQIKIFDNNNNNYNNENDLDDNKELSLSITSYKKDLLFNVFEDTTDVKYVAGKLNKEQNNKRIYLLYDSNKLGSESLYKISNMDEIDIKVRFSNKNKLSDISLIDFVMNEDCSNIEKNTITNKSTYNISSNEYFYINSDYRFVLFSFNAKFKDGNNQYSTIVSKIEINLIKENSNILSDYQLGINSYDNILIFKISELNTLINNNNYINLISDKTLLVNFSTKYPVLYKDLSNCNISTNNKAFNIYQIEGSNLFKKISFSKSSIIENSNVFVTIMDKENTIKDTETKFKLSMFYHKDNIKRIIIFDNNTNSTFSTINMYKGDIYKVLVDVTALNIVKNLVISINSLNSIDKSADITKCLIFKYAIIENNSESKLDLLSLFDEVDNESFSFITIDEENNSSISYIPLVIESFCDNVIANLIIGISQNSEEYKNYELGNLNIIKYDALDNENNNQHSFNIIKNNNEKYNYDKVNLKIHTYAANVKGGITYKKTKNITNNEFLLFEVNVGSPFNTVLNKDDYYYNNNNLQLNVNYGNELNYMLYSSNEIVTINENNLINESLIDYKLSNNEYNNFVYINLEKFNNNEMYVKLKSYKGIFSKLKYVIVEKEDNNEYNILLNSENTNSLKNSFNSYDIIIPKNTNNNYLSQNVKGRILVIYLHYKRNLYEYDDNKSNNNNNNNNDNKPDFTIFKETAEIVDVSSSLILINYSSVLEIKSINLPKIDNNSTYIVLISLYKSNLESFESYNFKCLFISNNNIVLQLSNESIANYKLVNSYDILNSKLYCPINTNIYASSAIVNSDYDITLPEVSIYKINNKEKIRDIANIDSYVVNINYNKLINTSYFKYFYLIFNDVKDFNLNVSFNNVLKNNNKLNKIYFENSNNNIYLNNISTILSVDIYKDSKVFVYIEDIEKGYANLIANKNFYKIEKPYIPDNNGDNNSAYHLHWLIVFLISFISTLGILGLFYLIKVCLNKRRKTYVEINDNLIDTSNESN